MGKTKNHYVQKLALIPLHISFGEKIYVKQPNENVKTHDPKSKPQSKVDYVRMEGEGDTSRLIYTNNKSKFEGSQISVHCINGPDSKLVAS